MSDRDRLDAEMRELLTQLSTVSHVPASSWDPKGRSGATEGGNRPPGDHGEVFWAIEYGAPFVVPTPRHPGCQTDTQRERVIARARDELGHLRGHDALYLIGSGHHARVATSKPTTGEIEGDDDTAARMLRETVGWTPDVVERSHFRMTAKLVRKIRLRHGHHPETGRPLEVPTGRNPKDSRSDVARADSESKAVEAQRLESLDYNLVEIAEILGVSRSTVERYLGRRAA